MQWWAWIAVGAILLGLEVFFVNAEFYLVFIGVAALVMGNARLLGMAAADWLQWLLFAALAAFFMVTFRRLIYERLRRRLPTLHLGPAGQIVVLPAALEPGESCRLEYRGSSWNAVNAGLSPIGAGARARIDRVDGLTLMVRAETSAF
jgi:membrane protein implicated in regulation of membrane protease activity